MASRIVITFDAPLPTDGNTIIWNYDFTESPYTPPPKFEVEVAHVFLSARSSAGTVTIGATNEDSAENYRGALAADLPSEPGSNFTVTRATNVVTIEAKAEGYEFYDYSCEAAGVTAVIINEPFVPEFAITATSLSPSVTPCTNASLTLTVENGTPPYTWATPNGGSVGLTNDVARTGTTIPVTIVDFNANEASTTVYVPLSPPDLIQSIESVTNPLGTSASVTVNINDEAEPSLTYEYSIDGSTWQLGNVFPSVLDGTYTCYVRDSLNCVISQGFTVDVESTVVVPIAQWKIPRSNSIKYALAGQSYNDITRFRNIDNSLYRNYRLGYDFHPCFVQKFIKNETITTQLRSNYETITAKLQKYTESNTGLLEWVLETTYSVEKKIDNIGILDIRDCRIYDRGNSNTGIYFASGNIYDSDGLIIDGYVLDGNLPEWAVVGQNITITDSDNNGTFQIKQIVYDETIPATVAVISNTYIGTQNQQIGRTTVVYDRLPYDVYEIEKPFLGLEDGIYRVIIDATDTAETYPNITEESEPFQIKTKHEFHNLIQYSGSRLDGIDYSTGIEHRLWTYGLLKWTKPEEDITVIKNAKSSLTKLRHIVGRSMKLRGYATPPYMIEKVILALSHDYILVNGVEYQIDESAETEEPDTSDVWDYSITLKMVNFENYQTDNVQIGEVPGALEQEQGHILL